MNKLKNRRDKIIVSFCNMSKSRESGLVSYDFANSVVEWLDMGFQGGVKSCTGLWREGDNIYSLFMSEGVFYVSVINAKTLLYVFCQPLEEVKDGHSICVLGRHLYVVSTGTDEVLRYELKGDGLKGAEVFWKASDENQDTHHLNSVLPVNGDICVTGFGPKDGTLWRTATHGYIYNITSDRFVKRDIYHPHTLVEFGGRLYYCESSTQVFCSVDGLVKFSLDGYTRGICFLDNKTVAVGTSVGRKSSKSTGIVYNPADPGDKAGSCAISVHSLVSDECLKVDMSEYTAEIYDICRLR
ncbi:MAG: DUF4915 domain-containing protein [Thermodesulfobacteriota bacterium]